MDNIKLSYDQIYFHDQNCAVISNVIIKTGVLTGWYEGNPPSEAQKAGCIDLNESSDVRLMIFCCMVMSLLFLHLSFHFHLSFHGHFTHERFQGRHIYGIETGQLSTMLFLERFS